jgi:hypothetical protein
MYNYINIDNILDLIKTSNECIEKLKEQLFKILTKNITTSSDAEKVYYIDKYKKLIDINRELIQLYYILETEI